MTKAGKQDSELVSSERSLQDVFPEVSFTYRTGGGGGGQIMDNKEREKANLRYRQCHVRAKFGECMSISLKKFVIFLIQKLDLILN